MPEFDLKVEKDEVPLTEMQIFLLESKKVGYDGWTKKEQVAAAQDLVARGYMTAKDLGSDEMQYTYIQCTITQAGEEALEKIKNGTVKRS